VEHSDLLEQVVAELSRRTGELPRVAKESGLSYDTVLRIKNRENDPGYSKVRALAAYLFPSEKAAA
jgi:predicted transcriptional regulator